MFIVAALLLSFALPCDEALQSAANALRQRDAKTAENILQAAAESCGQSADYLELRGVASQLSGNLPAAQGYFEKALLLRPDSPSLRTRLGAVYFQEKRFQDASRMLVKALQADPKNMAAGKLLAGSYVALQQWQQANQVFRHFESGSAPNPLLNEPLIIMWFAQTLIEVGPARLDSDLSPDAPGMTPDVLFSLGGLFAQHRLYKQEVRFLSQIPGSAADDAVYFNLGLAYSHLREFENARDCYFKAIDKHPQHVDAYLHVGLDYASQGDRRKSLPWLMRAHRLAPERADAAYPLVEALIDLQYLDTAGQILDGSPKGDPLLAAARGDLALAKGDSRQATEIYENVLKVKRNLVPALVGMARAELSEGKDVEAEPFLKEALAVDPENPVTNAELGLLKVKQSEYQAALQYLSAAWLDDRSNGKVALAMARVYEHEGKPAQAISVLTPLQNSMNDSTDYQMELAKLHRMLGQRAAEKDALDRLNILESDKKSPIKFDDPRVYVF